MKTNYYILLILLLSFSFANAQSNVEVKKIESTVMISNNNDEVSTSLENNINTSTIEEEGSTEATLIEDSLARINSDIKIYLNRLRNVENIDLLFPTKNKIVKA